MFWAKDEEAFYRTYYLEGGDNQHNPVHFVLGTSLSHHRLGASRHETATLRNTAGSALNKRGQRRGWFISLSPSSRRAYPLGCPLIWGQLPQLAIRLVHILKQRIMPFAAIERLERWAATQFIILASS